MKLFPLCLLFSALSLSSAELNNSWIKAELTPEKGIYIKNLILPDGSDLGSFGFFRVYNSPAVDSLKKLSGKVVKTSADRLSAEIQGREDILQNLDITEKIILPPDRAALTVEYSIRNRGEKEQLFGFTIQNFPGMKNAGETCFFPLDQGVFAQRVPAPSEQWFYTSASNWCGMVSNKGPGVALVMTPFPKCLYMWSSGKASSCSLEWRYPQRLQKPGETILCGMTVIPFTGLRKISGAGENIVGELRPDKALLYGVRKQRFFLELCDSAGKVLQNGTVDFQKPGILQEVPLKKGGAFLRILDENKHLAARLDGDYVLPSGPGVPEYVSTDLWYGYPRWNFKVNGCNAWIVCPSKAAPGNPWSWCMEFPTAFTERCAALELLGSGYHHGHIRVGNTFGCPAAIRSFNAFYALTQKLGLSPKAVLIGISRGGLYAYRFASENPEKVSVIYGDAPVCDFKSWPAGFGKGTGSKNDWKNLKQLYGFSSDEAAKAYRGNPVDILAVLAAKKVALIHVVGMADKVVPPGENTDIVEKRYRELDGEIRVIRRPGVGHHPHGLDDSSEVVRFILENNR